MIGHPNRFGRSTGLSVFFITSVVILILQGLIGQLWAIGSSGLYVTRVKMEYQYSDYDKFGYPLVESDDPLRGYEYLNPYLFDFPEHRFLSRIMQAIGPQNILEVRYEYSDLNLEKTSQRYFLRYDRILNQTTTLFASGQYLKIRNTSPDSSSNAGGYAFGVGLKYDLSGWIKGETSISYDQLRTSDDMVIRTISPMINLRYAIDGKTAIGIRWEGYKTESDSGNHPANATTLTISRYLPTNTGLHFYVRFYNNSYGIRSFSPAVELAQYILWNLSVRCNYRYYNNKYKEAIAPQFINGGTITASSIRMSVDWQARPDLKIVAKFRRYISDQDIRMNTYLLSFEYEL